ncbi:MAG: C39 family peptidase [Chloroflexi bacterium]|nr:C39 family peptidase [Chloroflexota bacterium]MBK6709203.1 C39 family peptidase [Chloroflexota bacterium]MBP7590504.1 C39 family peptidase [Chloroflexota bacterium]
MRYFRRYALLLLALGVLGGLALWQTLPWWVNMAPAPVQQRLPHQVLALASTPLPTALPAPTQDRLAATAVIIIPTLPPPAATATSQPTTQPTNQPSRQPTIQPTRQPTRPPTATPGPTAVRLTGLQITPQKFNNCGPTNLSIVLNYYGVPDDQFAVAAVARPTYEDRNVSPEELADYVNNQTPLRAVVLRGGRLETLTQLLAAGFPVIVEKGLLPSEWEGWMGHYLTVIGYDEAAQEFISLDTFLGPWDGSGRTDSFETMAEYWAQFNHVYLVVYPAERETAVAAIIGDTLTDPVLMWQRAAEQAQQETGRAPENGFAWFNLGSSLTRLGKLTGEQAYFVNAAAAFDRALTAGLPWRMLWYQFEPYEAYLRNGRADDVLTLTTATLQSTGGQFVEETHLYRGYALLAQGDESGAKAAWLQALAINPDLAEASQALAALHASGDASR